MLSINSQNFDVAFIKIKAKSICTISFQHMFTRVTLNYAAKLLTFNVKYILKGYTYLNKPAAKTVGLFKYL